MSFSSAIIMKQAAFTHSLFYWHSSTLPVYRIHDVLLTACRRDEMAYLAQRYNTRRAGDEDEGGNGKLTGVWWVCIYVDKIGHAVACPRYLSCKTRWLTHTLLRPTILYQQDSSGRRAHSSERI